MPIDDSSFIDAMKNNDDLLLLYDNGEWRRWMEEDQPFAVNTHFMVIDKTAPHIQVSSESNVGGMGKDELDAETIASIEAMADETFTAVKAMEFAEWKDEHTLNLKNGKYVLRKDRHEYHTMLDLYRIPHYTIEQLYDEFEKYQHREFNKKVEERKNKNHETD